MTLPFVLPVLEHAGSVVSVATVTALLTFLFWISSI